MYAQQVQSGPPVGPARRLITGLPAGPSGRGPGVSDLCHTFSLDKLAQCVDEGKFLQFARYFHMNMYFGACASTRNQIGCLWPIPRALLPPPRARRASDRREQPSALLDEAIRACPTAPEKSETVPVLDTMKRCCVQLA